MFIQILGHIFYFIGLFDLIMSFSNMFNFLKFITIKNWFDSFKKITGKDAKKSDFRSPEDYNIFSIYVTFIFAEFFWLLFGLATSSWYIFLPLLTLDMCYKFFVSSTSNLLSLKKVIGQTFSCIKFSIILILILNHFHLHINWIELFR